MAWYFFKDDGKKELKVTKKTRKQASDSRARYFKKGYGVSRIMFTLAKK